MINLKNTLFNTEPFLVHMNGSHLKNAAGRRLRSEVFNKIQSTTYSGEGSITLTVDAYISEISFEGYGELTKTDPSITIATNETAYIGPFPTGSYIDPQGQTTFTVSANYASVRVAILEIK